MLSKYYDSCLERSKIIWTYYNKNRKLLTQDIYNLTGVRSRDLYASFKRYGIEGPPIWDSNLAKAQRKSKILMDEVRRTGKSGMTLYHAAKLLNDDRRNMDAILSKMIEYGVEVPDIY